MPRVDHLNTLTASKLSVLLTQDEFLSINNNTISIVSCRTGMTNHFYFLPRIPRAVYHNPSNPDYICVVYGSTSDQSETLSVIESRSGSLCRQYTLKSSAHKFTEVSVGSSLVFMTSLSRKTVHSVPLLGGDATTFESSVPIKAIAAFPSIQQYSLIRDDNLIQHIDSKGPKVMSEVSVPSFINMGYFGDNLVVSVDNHELRVINPDSNQFKAISTPRGNMAIDYSGSYALSSDGFVFSINTGDVLRVEPFANKIFNSGSTVVTIVNDTAKIYELVIHSVISSSEIQPGEPFNRDEYYIEPSIYFASQNAVYMHNIAQQDNSKFASLTNVTSMVASQGITTIISNNKAITYVAGARMREDEGLHTCSDVNSRVWILHKERIFSLVRDNLKIKELVSIPLPQEHSFDRIFRFRDTVAVYSSVTGDAAFIEDAALVPFRLPKDCKIIKWPAICVEDEVFICQDSTGVPSNYESVDAKITSCCWFMSTLFAVEGTKLCGISLDAQKRTICLLPNATCEIASVLPSKIILVTSVPDLRIIYLLRSAMIDSLPFLSGSPDELRRFMSFLPSTNVDIHLLSELHPRLAMSILSIMKPASVTQEAISLYTRFGKFEELKQLATECKGDLESVAKKARLFGQFETAREIYTELGDLKNLFELFIITRSISNLEVLGYQSEYESVIRGMGISPREGEYSPLENLQLPETLPLVEPLKINMYLGDETMQTPVFVTAFDEISDFGIREILLNEDEIESATFGQAPPPEEEAPVMENIEYKERPKEVETKPDDTLKMDRFFGDEDDQPTMPVLAFKIGTKPPGETKQRKTSAKFQLKLDDGISSATLPITRRRSGTLRPREPNIIPTGLASDHSDTNGSASDSGTSDADVHRSTIVPEVP